MRKVSIFLTLFLGICLVFSFAINQKDLKTYKDKPVFLPDEIVVTYDTSVTESEKSNLGNKYGWIKKQESKKPGKFHVYKHNDKAIEKTLEKVRKEKGVLTAERNAYAYAAFVPNDPYYSPYQWHMTRIGMENAWDLSTGSGVVVAVLDTGVRQSLEDMAGTTFMAGYDFINNDNDPSDDEGHGSHVAGTIAQTTHNGVGVTGVAYNCTIMPVKVLDSSGSGAYTVIVDGIYYAADNGADVINLSLGGYSDLSIMENAINYAWNNGVVVVCAAGNDSTTQAHYPSAYPNSISVSATDYGDDLASYSNYGSTIDIAAPGGDFEDLNGDGYDDGVLQNTFVGSDVGYYFFMGTSMASPHVAGVAALVKSIDPTLTNAGIRNILETTAEDIGSATYFGNGLVDAHAAALAAGGTGNQPPTAAFTYSANLLTVDFTDQSTDPDGTIVGWAWNFGDTGTSGAQHPTHTYAASGTYTVTLTVTDNEGATDTTFQDVTVSDGTVVEIFVQDIAVNVIKVRRRYRANAVITIYDTNNAPVANATVYIAWSGAVNRTGNKVTNASGQVTFTSRKSKSTGPFTITVTNVTHATLPYNPTLNIETSDSATY